MLTDSRSPAAYSRLPLNARSPVHPLPSLNADGELVRRPGQRTGRVRAGDARRVVGTVEVDNDAPVRVRRAGVEEAAAAVGFLAVRLVPEDQPHLAVLATRQRLEPIRDTGDLEDDIARRLLLVDGAEDVGHRH